MLAGETWGDNMPSQGYRRTAWRRADQLNTAREGKEGAEMRQHPVHRSSASFCKRSPEAGRHSLQCHWEGEGARKMQPVHWAGASV